MRATRHSLTGVTPAGVGRLRRLGRAGPTCRMRNVVARPRHGEQPLRQSGSSPDGRTRMAAQKKWQLTGDYFENCNCDVVCPCLVSPSAPLTARPTQGACDVAIAFYIDRGDYDGVALDGLNVAVVGH